MPRLQSKIKVACYFLYPLSISLHLHATSTSAFSSTSLIKLKLKKCHPPLPPRSTFELKLAPTSTSTSTSHNDNPTPTTTINHPNKNNDNDPIPLFVKLLSSTLINSAIDVLEEQYFRRPDTPIDSILRTYVKQSSHSHDYDLEEKDALREIVLDVARNQYKIDFGLKQIGLECTPENRVVAHAQNYPEKNESVKNLLKSYKWVKKFQANSKSNDDSMGNIDMDLQTRLECPDWAWPGLNEAFPTEDELTCQLEGLLQPPPLDLRVNTLKCKATNDNAAREEALFAIQSTTDFHNNDVIATAAPWSPLGIRLNQRVPLETIPGLLKGVVEPQDEGSQLVASLLDAQPGETIADYCAGTGGKTLAIAAQMQNKGRLYSLDVSGDRLERGRPRCAKAGVDNVQRQTVQADMDRKDKWCKKRKRTFDRVLVDAPCSGVGSWRRKPDARRTWGGVGYSNKSNNNDEGVQRLKELLPLQQHILRRAARLVKPGGRLVYVTCSLLPEENEHQIEDFMQCEEGKSSGWEVDVPTPADFAVPFEAGNGKYLRLTPAQHGTDGFFAAVLRRRDEDEK